MNGSPSSEKALRAARANRGHSERRSSSEEESDEQITLFRAIINDAVEKLSVGVILTGAVWVAMMILDFPPGLMAREAFLNAPHAYAAHNSPVGGPWPR